MYQPYATYQNSTPGPRPVPAPVRRAVYLMYAAGGLTAVAALAEAALTMVFSMLAPSAFPAGVPPKGVLPPGVHPAAVHPVAFQPATFSPVNVVFPLVIVLPVVAFGFGLAAVWFVLGAKCKAGRPWARTVATVLCGVSTFWLLASAFSLGSHLPVVFFPSVIWLLGVAAVILLWQRPASDFFHPAPGH